MRRAGGGGVGGGGGVTASRAADLNAVLPHGRPSPAAPYLPSN